MSEEALLSHGTLSLLCPVPCSLSMTVDAATDTCRTIHIALSVFSANLLKARLSVLARVHVNNVC